MKINAWFWFLCGLMIMNFPFVYFYLIVNCVYHKSLPDLWLLQLSEMKTFFWKFTGLTSHYATIKCPISAFPNLINTFRSWLTEAKWDFILMFSSQQMEPPPTSFIEKFYLWRKFQFIDLDYRLPYASCEGCWKIHFSDDNFFPWF